MCAQFGLTIQVQRNQTMKRKIGDSVTSSSSTPASKKAKVSPEHRSLPAGSLHLSALGKEISLGDSTLLMTNVISIKSTISSTLILKKGGSVLVCHGPDLDEFKEIAFPGKAVQITAGSEHAACLLDDGRAFIWGGFQNPGYRFRDQFMPQQILPKKHIVEIASGWDHLLALTSDGVVYSMGCGKHGQLGRVPRRSALDGGRRGVRLLLEPGEVHKHRYHRVDKIWATERGSYYRDANTKEIFGFGQVAIAAPAKGPNQEVSGHYKPMLTEWTDLQDIGHDLALTEAGQVLEFEQGKAQPGKWRQTDREGVTHIKCGGGNGPNFLIGSGGRLSIWKANKATPPFHIRNGKETRVLDISQVGDKIFLVVA